MNEHLRIIRFECENIKRLEAVAIEPTGNLIQVTGRNGAGKSSVLDAILFALAGERAIQMKPVRKGEESATIRLDLGEFVVTRYFRVRKRKEGESGPEERTTTRVSVETPEGARFGSPQGMLDALTGGLAFDPLEFLRERPDARARRVAQACGIELAEFASADKRDYGRRRDLNRDAKRKRAERDGIGAAPDDTPDEPPDTAALSRDLEALRERNAGRETERTRRQGERAAIGVDLERAAARRQRAASLRAEAESCDEEAAGIERECATRADELDALPEIAATEDPGELQAAIAEAGSVTLAVQRKRDRARLESEIRDLETAAAELTDALAARKRELAAKVAAAELPVAGLALDERDGAFELSVDALPFEQASDARQLEVSVALAMAENPRLRVLRVRDGSLLDADSLAALGRLAERHEYQIWLERVGEPSEAGGMAVVIEAGKLKTESASKPEPATEPAGEPQLFDK